MTFPTPVEMLRTSAEDMDQEATALDAANERAMRKMEKRTRQANEYRALAASLREAAEALSASATSPTVRIRQRRENGTFAPDTTVTGVES